MSTQVAFSPHKSGARDQQQKISRAAFPRKPAVSHEGRIESSGVDGFRKGCRGKLVLSAKIVEVESGEKTVEKSWYICKDDAMDVYREPSYSRRASSFSSQFLRFQSTSSFIFSLFLHRHQG